MVCRRKKQLCGSLEPLEAIESSLYTFDEAACPRVRPIKIDPLKLCKLRRKGIDNLERLFSI